VALFHTFIGLIFQSISTAANFKIMAAKGSTIATCVTNNDGGVAGKELEAIATCVENNQGLFPSILLYGIIILMLFFEPINFRQYTNATCIREQLMLPQRQLRQLAIEKAEAVY
jgi:hypothetical protein